MDDEKLASAANAAGSNDAPLSTEDQALLEAYSHTFIGSYAHSLDSKGRLVIPQAFREDLGSTFYICPSMDLTSISLYTNIAWARTRRQYERLGEISGKFKRFLELFDALSYRGQECDGQGRVLLPNRIRQMILGDEKDVEITGANDHVRIISARANEQMIREMMDHRDEFTSLFDELSKLLMSEH